MRTYLDQVIQAKARHVRFTSLRLALQNLTQVQIRYRFILAVPFIYFVCVFAYQRKQFKFRPMQKIIK